MRERWKNFLMEPTLPGRRVIQAILPVFDSWLNRGYGQLDYYTTQMMTGHGAFRGYLFRFNLVDSDVCLHCRRVADTVQHTIEECPEWQEERRILQTEVSRDLSLASIVAGMLTSPKSWAAFQRFSEVVLKKKETFVRDLVIAGVIDK